MEAIEKKGDTLSAVYKRALVAAGSGLKQPDEGSDLDNDRANIESESDEQEDSEHEEHAWIFNNITVPLAVVLSNAISILFVATFPGLMDTWDNLAATYLHFFFLINSGEWPKCKNGQKGVKRCKKE